MQGTELRVETLTNGVLTLGVSRQGGHIARFDFHTGHTWCPILACAADKPYIDQYQGTENEFVSGSWTTLGARTEDLEGRPGIIPWHNPGKPIGEIENLPCGRGQYQKEFAIHHIDCRRPWVVQADGDLLYSAFMPENPVEVFPEWFPFAHTLEKTYRLSDNMLECWTVYTNTSGKYAPATFGDHFFWMREVLESSGMPEFKFHASGVYPKNKEGILLPRGGIKKKIPLEWDFSGGMEVPYGLDHCYRLHYREPISKPRFAVAWTQPDGSIIVAEVTMSVKYNHVVVFSPRDGDVVDADGNSLFDGTVAGEIQTGCSSPFAQFARGVQHTGLVILEPGETLEARWCIKVRHLQG